MAENKQGQPVPKPKFPSEVVDLPSGGRCYPKDSPLASGKIELKYMTTREEDILTSANLVKKGLVIDKLLDSIIMTPGVRQEDLVLGDKNGVLVAARILAYGAEYSAEVEDPSSGEKTKITFDLASCDFKKLPEDVDYSNNEFEFKLPISKNVLTFKLLTGKEEKLIEQDLKGQKKLGRDTELSSRLKYMILAIDGDDKRVTVNTYVENMLAKDSLEFRKYLDTLQPDINMEQDVEIGGEIQSMAIPMGVEFFWPQATS